MHDFCLRHRIPAAGVDAIDDAATALRFLAAIGDRSVPSIITLLLDDQRRGMTVLHVDTDGDDDGDDDAVLLAAGHAISWAHEQLGVASAIVASVRPHGSDHVDDIDRWCELDALYASAGIELVEWFVIASSVSTPRSLLGEPSRWRSNP